MPIGKMGSKGRDSDLGEPLELKAEVASFLHGSSETSNDEDVEMPLELAVLKFADWVWWKAEECDPTSWWAELLTVLGKKQHQETGPER